MTHEEKDLANAKDFLKKFEKANFEIPLFWTKHIEEMLKEYPKFLENRGIIKFTEIRQ